MALKATIFKAQLHIADMDRHYYQAHSLTLARHPSETDVRMMARVAVFALNAEPGLNFTKGLSTDDEPDLWRKDDSQRIEQWIELGQPDEKRLRRACGKADEVKVYCYTDKAADVWWESMQNTLQRFDNLSVIQLDGDAIEKLGNMAQRSMILHCNIEDGILNISNDEQSLDLAQSIRKSARQR